MSTNDLAQIARQGGAFAVDGCAYSLGDLLYIAGQLRNGGAMTVRGNDGLSHADLIDIAKASPGRVLFDH